MSASTEETYTTLSAGSNRETVKSNENNANLLFNVQLNKEIRAIYSEAKRNVNKPNNHFAL